MYNPFGETSTNAYSGFNQGVFLKVGETKPEERA